MFPAVQRTVEQALGQVGPYLASLVQRAAPAPAMVKALGEELQRAERDPRSVSHPELLDPTVFWAKSAWPQAAAVVKHARVALLGIAEELARVVHGSEQVLDGWLVAQVEAGIAQADDDPVARRDVAIDAVASHCEGLHRVVDQLTLLAPTVAVLSEARSMVDAARRDEAERTWAKAMCPNVAARDQELRSQVPFRHQDLLLAAHDQAIEAIARDVYAMVDELTEPILGIGERLVRRYDELVGSVPITTFDRTPQ